MKKLKYIVTGTGRCGTVFMARFLTSLGIPCGHESIFYSDGLDMAVQRLTGHMPIRLSNVSKADAKNDLWLENLNNIEADSSYMAAPYLNQECLRESVVIHVVRHPVRVVNSFCNYINYFENPTPKDGYEANIYNHLPLLKEEMPTYDRAALYYVMWNEMIEEALLNRGFFFHRIEDNKQELLEFLDCQPTNGVFNNTKVNTFKKPGASFQIDHISNKDLKKRFVDMGRRYGYNMSSEYLLI